MAEIHEYADGETVPNVRRVKVDDRALVVRRNELVLGKYELTLQESRLFYWIMSMVEANDDTFKTYEIAINELAKLIGLEGNGSVYEQMVNATKRLGSRTAEVRKPDEKRLIQIWIFGSVEYLFGEGKMRIKLNEEMRPYLLGLKEKYTKVELRYMLRMKSFYAQRVYDFLKANEFRGHRIEVTLEELRQICGIEKGALKRGNDVVRMVVDIAKREINAGTDLEIEYQVVKRARAISSIVFIIRPSSSEPIEYLPGSLNYRMYQSLLRHGIKNDEARSIVKDWGDRDPDRIIWHVGELDKKLKEGGIKSPIAWLRAGIRDDYRPQRVVFEARDEQKRQREEDDAKGGDRKRDDGIKSISELLQAKKMKSSQSKM